MELQQSREDKHYNNLFCKDQTKWDPADPKQSLTSIREYFKSLQETKKATCSCMLHPHIVALTKNKTIGLFWDPDKTMIERCSIIPIKQHRIYHNRPMPSCAKRFTT